MIFWGRGKQRKYASEVIALDIETSWNHDSENPKTWIVSIQLYFLGNYYLFRSPMELIEWYLGLIKRYALNPGKKIITIIHNASFDLSYLIQYFQEFLPLDEVNGVYSDKNKIISYSQGGLEWRCTYFLTQMSLEKWSNEMKVEHPKKVGLYDYSKVIYQDDELTENELEYDKADVLSLYEAFYKQLEAHSDNTSTVPLTSTGYARRLYRNNAKKDKYYRQKYFQENRLDLKAYKYCVNSFSGGYTHNNRLLKSRIIKAEDYGVKSIGHRDFRSMYPSIMRSRPMPMGKPEVYYDVTKRFYREGVDIEIDDVLNLFPQYSSITHLILYEGTKLHDFKTTMPFLQRSKCRKESSRPQKFCCTCDNGRILSINKGYAEMYVDNFTLEIIQKQYHLEYAILGVIRFKNESLPKCLADTVDALFKDKSDYKIKQKEAEKLYGLNDDRTQELLFKLNLTKRLLNATFGMLCTNPIRDIWDIDYGRLDNEDEEERNPFYKLKSALTDAEMSEALDKYYSGKNNFLPYQAGIFVTAMAKAELHDYMEVIGYEKILYADTDSLFYLKDEDTERAINKLNAKFHKTAPYIEDANGERVYYDVFEAEEDLIAFKGLHSKCYGVVTERGEVQFTIAGIPAKTLIGTNDGKPIYLTREEELSGITKEIKLKYKRGNNKVKNPLKALDKLTDEATFKVNTGTTCRYMIDKIHTEIIKGHKTILGGGAIISTLDEKQILDIDSEQVDNLEEG